MGVPLTLSPPMAPQLRGQQSPLSQITATTMQSKDFLTTGLGRVADELSRLRVGIQQGYPSAVPILERVLQGLSMLMSEIQGNRAQGAAIAPPSPLEPLPAPRTSASPVEGAVPGLA